MHRTITVIEDEFNNHPIIEDVQDLAMYSTDDLSILNSYYASDFEDGNITSQVKITGQSDYSTLGTYEETLGVTNSKGVTTTTSRTITILKDIE